MNIYLSANSDFIAMTVDEKCQMSFKFQSIYSWKFHAHVFYICICCISILIKKISYQ